MMTKLWAGCLASLALALGLGGTAAAQSCATCATSGVGGNVQEKPCGICGQRVYPRCENRYIRQFCQPTICPGSCFGYFKTQWTAWNQACPNWGANCAEAPVAGNFAPPIQSQPIQAVPANTLPYIPGSPAPYTPPAQGSTIPPAAEGNAPLPAPTKQPAPKEQAPPPKQSRSGKTPAPIPVIPAQPISDGALTLPPVPDVQIAVPGSKSRS